MVSFEARPATTSHGRTYWTVVETESGELVMSAFGDTAEQSARDYIDRLSALEPGQ